MKLNDKFDTNINAKNVYFTSDTHFGHSNIMRFCQRPFSDVTDMNNCLIENWNNKVGKDDIIFHLGDFAMGGSNLWNGILERLNGHKILILGNHKINKF